MRRREFIALVGGVAASTLAARAQRPERIRKIGVLMNLSSEDPEGQARVKAYAQALQKLGWIDGGNMRTEIRWAANDADRYRRYSEELVALAPDVILAGNSPSVVALQRLTHSVPIVSVFGTRARGRRRMTDRHELPARPARPRDPLPVQQSGRCRDTHHASQHALAFHWTLVPVPMPRSRSSSTSRPSRS
jgi:hypothetical protein